MTTTWEYQRILEWEGSDRFDEIEAAGEEGWELVGVAVIPDRTGYTIVYYFKRPVNAGVVG